MNWSNANMNWQIYLNSTIQQQGEDVVHQDKTLEDRDKNSSIIMYRHFSYCSSEKLPPQFIDFKKQLDK